PHPGIEMWVFLRLCYLRYSPKLAAGHDDGHGGSLCATIVFYGHAEGLGGDILWKIRHDDAGVSLVVWMECARRNGGGAMCRDDPEFVSLIHLQRVEFAGEEYEASLGRIVGNSAHGAALGQRLGGEGYADGSGIGEGVHKLMRRGGGGVEAQNLAGLGGEGFAHGGAVAVEESEGHCEACGDGPAGPREHAAAGGLP